MKTNKLVKPIIIVLAAAIAGFSIYRFIKKQPSAITKESEGDEMSFDVESRQQWELNRLRDPNTGMIPVDIRAKELEFAASLPKADAFRKSGDIWEPMGPWNIGGRTRAIAIDITDENILLAGGVSGGIWRSGDKGANWTKTTTQKQVLAITCITQDTRPGKTNIWYAGTGELSGSSASKGGAYFSGNGILKSVDGGKTWQPLTYTTANTPQFDSDFDGCWNIAISPLEKDTNIVYAAVYGGIYRSTNAGGAWQRRRGGTSGGQTSYYTDVAVAKNGVVYATLSSEGPNRGIWRSTDLGLTWINILPANFPTTYQRMVIGLVPQDENSFYILAVTPNSGKKTTDFRGTEEWNSLWKYTYLSGDGSGAGGRWEDRSASIPDFPGDFEKFNSQGGYNLLVRVHPADSNIVVIGGTGLFRSTDAFRSSSNITKIGGYAQGTQRPDFKLYENHHPDQHNFVFFTSSPDKALSTHDGGISLTDDIKAGTVKWSSLNNGFTTTQFYTVAINEAVAGDYTIIGGLQDNGTLLTNKYDRRNPWSQVFSYDGAFCHVAANGQDYYVTKQEAGLYRIRLDGNNQRIQSARLDPPGLNNYTFINPWCVDPNDDKRIFLVHDSAVWRNNDITEFPLDNFLDSNRDMGSWQELAVTPNKAAITAISMSVQPAGTLFYGTGNGWLFKIPGATAGTPAAVNITGANFPAGNINNICVHPEDADKIIAVFSNYGILSLFYTDNGGTSWQDISGNLEQNTNGTGNGPSCRWAAFVKTNVGYGVLVGTSVGLFATSQLNGTATVWIQQSPETIGNAVCEMIKVRRSDSRVVVATHGAGVFAANITQSYHLTGIGETINARFSVYPNPTTDEIVVSAPGFKTGEVYTIFNMLGKTVLETPASGEETRINVTMLPAGVYIVRVKNGTTENSLQFIKK